jgi:hypothetical protein
VLDIFWHADASSELFWRVDEGELTLYAMCSDWFHWASADLEPITPADVPLLKQTWADLLAIGRDDAERYLCGLYACRRRRMRPMVQVFTDDHAAPPAVQALLAACGDERHLGDEDWWKPGAVPLGSDVPRS